jgi:hypothetical protein
VKRDKLGDVREHDDGRRTMLVERRVVLSPSLVLVWAPIPEGKTEQDLGRTFVGPETEVQPLDWGQN